MYKRQVVDAAVFALIDHHIDGFAVVFHVEPVAYVLSLAIYGEVLALQDVVDDQGNELLGELIGSVVVRASCDAYGHVIGVAIGTYEVVGRGF